MQRAQLGPPLVHVAKFDQNRLKDLGARRVDDRQTDRHTDKQTQAIIRAILRIGPITRAGINQKKKKHVVNHEKHLTHEIQIITTDKDKSHKPRQQQNGNLHSESGCCKGFHLGGTTTTTT